MEEKFESSYTVGKYLKKVNDSFNIDQNKSLTDILESFRLISKDYQKFNSSKEEDIVYSDNDFNKCPENEQLEFINDQLQFINCLVIDSIYQKRGEPVSWQDIWTLVHDPIYAKTDKINRKVVYATESNNRPIGDVAYSVWNGLQIIDLDIKDAELANKLKPVLFDELKKYHWFLGVCTSASGKGLHVWTKIRPISIEFKNRKVEYLCNFRHKYSYVYIVLMKYMEVFGYTKNNIFDYMDMAMAKPQQGIFITSDNTSYLNTHFKELRLDVGFESAFNTGIESINWITHPDLKNIFSKLEWFNNESFDEESNIEISNLENVAERDYTKSLGRKHYKHAQRWQLANTLVNIFGQDKALQIMVEVCAGTDKRELKGDVKTAAIHNKPISLWAVNELNKQHGFKIEIKGTDAYKKEIEQLDKEFKKESTVADDPTKVLNDKTESTKLYLKKDQYLGDIKDDIIANLTHITLLEAGAGYGKTEMIKALKAKTLLILPFTSTIKAKVESSETTKDWLYYYGSKKPTLDELLGNKSMSMTIDKFSRLNVMELDTANFEYIVIDESHLLFTSSYRDVMSPCIQRLANCKAKIIMMTGTPTGEMLFFPNITHIKVVKEDVRIKTFQMYMCPTNTEQLIEMAKAMSNDIMEGKKVLFPTNKGNLYFEQVTGLIQQYLDSNKFGRQLKAFYYKKSNTGDDSMDHINIDKSIGDNDIIFCTTYLSVGVDICDRFTFSVYFNEQWIPQDIEQFANRLRNNDLYLKMFLPKKDSSGGMINYYNTQPLDLSFDKKDLLLARDLIKTCNDVIERNEQESKYNPLISHLLSSNKYLKYDENDCKYYIDETTYKLKVFEERYSDFSKQLAVMLNGMKYYGYQTEIIDLSNEVPEEKKEELNEYLKSCRHMRFNYTTTQTFLFLDHVNDGNIDIYRELLKGSYEIFKGEEYKEVRGDNNLYVEDIEVLEKNVPIILSLYKFFDCDVIKDIYQFCLDTKQNRINFSKLDKIRKFVNIEYNRRKMRLDFPILKFVKDTQAWAKENPIVNKNDINVYLADYTAKYCNSIKNVVVQDIDLMETIFDIVNKLWSVIIVQSRPKNGEITIVPFELLWERKGMLEDIYGDKNTKDFFLQELTEEMREELDNVNEEVLPELPKTEKLTLDDVEDELVNVVHKEFDYKTYSELDDSNNRFLRKQENTNQLKENIFITTEAPTTTTEEPNLFNQNLEPLPF